MPHHAQSLRPNTAPGGVADSMAPIIRRTIVGQLSPYMVGCYHSSSFAIDGTVPPQISLLTGGRERRNVLTMKRQKNVVNTPENVVNTPNFVVNTSIRLPQNMAIGLGNMSKRTNKSKSELIIEYIKKGVQSDVNLKEIMTDLKMPSSELVKKYRKELECQKLNQ